MIGFLGVRGPCGLWSARGRERARPTACSVIQYPTSNARCRSAGVPTGVFVWASVVLLAACGPVGSADDGSMDVLYAGSLTATMEEAIGPAFESSVGLPFRGEPHGSVAGAHLIRDGLRRPDVYITADTATLGLLGPHDPGWSIAFARGELAIGYAADGRWAAAFDSAAAGWLAWYDVVTRPGVRLGRTDPELDPKGYRTLWLFELAERHYERSGLAERLRAAAPERAVYPEAHLATRVEAGQLDAAVFYLGEARAHGLSVIRLPAPVHQGDPELAGRYAEMTYRDREGRIFRGTPILYAATVPVNARARDPGIEFIAFLLGGRARPILGERGFPPLGRVLGRADRVPGRLRTLAAGPAASAGPVPAGPVAVGPASAEPESAAPAPAGRSD